MSSFRTQHATRRPNTSTPYPVHKRSHRNEDEGDMMMTVNVLPEIIIGFTYDDSKSTSPSTVADPYLEDKALAERRVLRARIAKYKARREAARLFYYKEAIDLGIFWSTDVLPDKLALGALRRTVKGELERRKNPRALRRGIKFNLDDLFEDDVPAKWVRGASASSRGTVPPQRPKTAAMFTGGTPQQIMPSAPGKAPQRKRQTSGDEDGNATDEDTDIDTDSDNDSDEETDDENHDETSKASGSKPKVVFATTQSLPAIAPSKTSQSITYQPACLSRHGFDQPATRQQQQVNNNEWFTPQQSVTNDAAFASSSKHQQGQDLSTSSVKTANLHTQANPTPITSKSAHAVLPIARRQMSGLVHRTSNELIGVPNEGSLEENLAVNSDKAKMDAAMARPQSKPPALGIPSSIRFNAPVYTAAQASYERHTQQGDRGDGRGRNVFVPTRTPSEHGQLPWPIHNQPQKSSHAAAHLPKDAVLAATPSQQAAPPAHFAPDGISPSSFSSSNPLGPILPLALPSTHGFQSQNSDTTMNGEIDSSMMDLAGLQQQMWAAPQWQPECTFHQAPAQYQYEYEVRRQHPVPPPQPEDRANNFWGELLGRLGHEGVAADQHHREERRRQNSLTTPAPCPAPEPVHAPPVLMPQPNWWAAVSARDSLPPSAENRKRRVKERSGLKKRPAGGSKMGEKVKKIRRRVYHLPGDVIYRQERRETVVMDAIDQDTQTSYSQPIEMEKQAEGWVNPTWLNEGLVAAKEQPETDFKALWRVIKGLCDKVLKGMRGTKTEGMETQRMEEDEMYLAVAAQVCAEHGFAMPSPREMSVLVDEGGEENDEDLETILYK